MFEMTIAAIENEEQRNELAEFYSKHKNRLYSIALSKLHNKEDAEDAVQAVFSEIADKPEKFFEIPPDDRLAYTDVMLRNIAVDMFKKIKKVQVDELDEEIEDMTISLENNILDKISHDEIVAFMKQLPTEQKSVLLLHCYFGLTVYEVSQRLNISLVTTNRRLMLARKAIRDFIDERNANYE